MSKQKIRLVVNGKEVDNNAKPCKKVKLPQVMSAADLDKIIQEKEDASRAPR